MTTTGGTETKVAEVIGITVTHFIEIKFSPQLDIRLNYTQQLLLFLLPYITTVWTPVILAIINII